MGSGLVPAVLLVLFGPSGLGQQAHNDGYSGDKGSSSGVESLTISGALGGTWMAGVSSLSQMTASILRCILGYFKWLFIFVRINVVTIGTCI